MFDTLRQFAMTAGLHAVPEVDQSTAVSTNCISPVADRHSPPLPEAPGFTNWGSRLHDIAITKLLLPSSTAAAVVRLLEPQHLRSLLVQHCTRKWPLTVKNNNYRHHFYRQLAKLLGWRDRNAFLDEIKALLHEVSPDEVEQQQHQKWHGEEVEPTQSKKRKCRKFIIFHVLIHMHTCIEECADLAYLRNYFPCRSTLQVCNA